MLTDNPYARNQLYLIPVSELQPDPDQPRKFIDPAALQELTASVSQVGVLQPILFRSENGTKYIVAGERRFAAAQAAGLTEIPAIFVEGSKYGEIALIENIQRADLNPIEEAEAMDRLMKNHNYKQDDLSGIFSKSKASISETLSLNKLPQPVRDECRQDPSVPKRVLIVIARKKQERSMLTAWQSYRDKLNAQNNPKTGVKSTKVQSTINAMEATQEKMHALDISTLLQEEKDLFRQALETLETTAQEILTALQINAPGKPT
jgi:ParB family transcriptional regulator, chromosome partitioning protein